MVKDLEKLQKPESVLQSFHLNIQISIQFLSDNQAIPMTYVPILKTWDNESSKLFLQSNSVLS